MSSDEGVSGREVAESQEELLLRIKGEFLEMPGLRLTPVQARRLWGLELETCEALLDSLVEASFLKRTIEGAYQREN
ncbi:MAG: hypothetical protein AB7I50_03230 [Vicinamibacterales bacterium]